MGRVEAALGGVRLNTDAIDNSAGVDCSDHEVNIKILVNDAVTDGDMTLKQRNELLAKMTDDVGLLVLRDNYLQTQALSIFAIAGDAASPTSRCASCICSRIRGASTAPSNSCPATMS